eukprot:4904721-Lingulodinium_polyedra.AAC.1
MLCHFRLTVFCRVAAVAVYHHLAHMLRVSAGNVVLAVFVLKVLTVFSRTVFSLTVFADSFLAR